MAKEIWWQQSLVCQTWSWTDSALNNVPHGVSLNVQISLLKVAICWVYLINNQWIRTRRCYLRLELQDPLLPRSASTTLYSKEKGRRKTGPKTSTPSFQCQPHTLPSIHYFPKTKRLSSLKKWGSEMIWTTSFSSVILEVCHPRLVTWPSLNPYF